MGKISDTLLSFVFCLSDKQAEPEYGGSDDKCIERSSKSDCQPPTTTNFPTNQPYSRYVKLCQNCSWLFFPFATMCTSVLQPINPWGRYVHLWQNCSLLLFPFETMCTSIVLKPISLTVGGYSYMYFRIVHGCCLPNNNIFTV